MTNALEILNPLVFLRLDIYQLFPLFQTCLMLLAIYYLFRALTARQLARIDSLNGSLFFVLLFLCLMPSLAEGIYSFDSAIAYNTQLIVSALYLGMLADYFNGKYLLHKFLHILIASVLLIITMGFTEVVSMLLLCFHIGVLFIQKKGDQKIKVEWAWFSFLCLACLTVMVIAPGNNARGANYSDSHNFFRSVFFTAMQTARFGFSWIANVPLMMLSVLFISMIRASNNKISLFNPEYFFKPWASVFILAGILVVCIFPPYWATNILGQHRTVNTAFFFFLIYWFLCVGVYVNKYSEKTNFTILQNEKLKNGLIILAICILAVTGNGYDVFTDILYGRAKKFDAEMQERFDVLSSEASKGKTIYLRPLSEKPHSLFILDLGADSTDWINGCQAEYFGVRGFSERGLR